jgi:hypothetical protein
MRRRGLLIAGLVAALLALVGPASAVEDPKGSFGVVDERTGIWYLHDASNSETTSFYYGDPGDYPIMGDWDCNGVDTPGLYRQSDGYVYLRNSNTQGNADLKFYFGNPGDIPLAGDFNGDGCDTVSIYRPSQGRVYIINELGSDDGGLGAAELDYYFGDPGDKPFAGDFDGDGIDTIGLHRESTGLVYFRNSHTQGIAHDSFIYGDPGDKIIANEWAMGNGGGIDTVGIFRPDDGTFFLRFTNTQGNADFDQKYGNSDMQPVAGAFGALPGGDDPPPDEPYIPPPPPKITAPVFAVGDSVMLGVTCNSYSCYSPSINLEGTIPQLDSNARVSRGFRDGASVIASRLSRSPVPQVIVVHLGTNGAPSDADFAAVMNAARDVPRVLFLTVKQSRTSNETAANAVIRRNVPLYDNAELVDWYALASANPSWLAVDTNYGAHLWTTGARNGYVNLVASAVAAG